MSTIDKQALRWVVLQSERPLDDAEREAFDAWFAADIRHRGAMLRATAINRALSQAMVPEALRPHPERLVDEWSGGAWRQPTPRRAFLMYGAAAAGIAIAAGASWFRSSEEKIILATAKGEFRKVPLADGSVAHINSGTQLEVRLTPKLRQITLDRGEAWFEVAKDRSKPFVVDTGDVRVRAVGTAFSVRRFGDGAEVLVTEGTVEVSTNDSGAPKRMVTAGERATVADQTSEIRVKRDAGEIDRRLAWRDGRVVFLNQTLGDAVSDFNRYSSRKIIIADPELRSKKLVGQYQIDAPERFAKDVGAFLGVPISITPDRILIGSASAPAHDN